MIKHETTYTERKDGDHDGGKTAAGGSLRGDGRSKAGDTVFLDSGTTIYGNCQADHGHSRSHRDHRRHRDQFLLHRSGDGTDDLRGTVQKRERTEYFRNLFNQMMSYIPWGSRLWAQCPLTPASTCSRLPLKKDKASLKRMVTKNANKSYLVRGGPLQEFNRQALMKISSLRTTRGGFTTKIFDGRGAKAD